MSERITNEALDIISPVDDEELHDELESIKHAVEGLPKDYQPFYKFLYR